MNIDIISDKNNSNDNESIVEEAFEVKEELENVSKGTVIYTVSLENTYFSAISLTISWSPSNPSPDSLSTSKAFKVFLTILWNFKSKTNFV